MTEEEYERLKKKIHCICEHLSRGRQKFFSLLKGSHSKEVRTTALKGNMHFLRHLPKTNVFALLKTSAKLENKIISKVPRVR